jgi:hypothetical protein
LIGGHSTRIGDALDIAEPGCYIQELMRYGNWKSVQMPLRYTQSLTDAVNPIHRVRSRPLDAEGNHKGSRVSNSRAQQISPNHYGPG